MEDMLLKEVLDAGARSIGNRPDDLVRRSVLAQVLVRAAVFEDVEDALSAFRFWANPTTRETFDVDGFLGWMKTK